MNPDVSPLAGLILSEQTHLSLPSDPGLVEATAEYLMKRAELCGAVSPTRSAKLMIAFVEAITNAIVHGNLELSSDLKERGDDAFAKALALRANDPVFSKRKVDIQVDYDGTTCRWTITDEGRGFDVEKALKRAESDDPEILLASGRGLIIMRSFLDDIRWDWGGRRVVMIIERANATEKRCEPRLPLNHPMRIAPLKADGSVDWNAAYEAVARNLSSSGVAILQNSLRHADRVLVGLPIQGNLVYVPAEVRHVRNMSGEMLQLGCRFDLPEFEAQHRQKNADLAQAESAIDNMLEALSRQLPPDERRTYPRLPFSEPIEVRSPTLQKPAKAFARDLSRGGVAFVTSQPLAGEVTLVFRPRTDGPCLTIRSEVIRCTSVTEGLYDVGARFLGLAC
jgi:anti-sigma regulatory factor (Ser/Thr protein kinase)